MKRLILIILLTFFALNGFAQEWIYDQSYFSLDEGVVIFNFSSSTPQVEAYYPLDQTYYLKAGDRITIDFEFNDFTDTGTRRVVLAGLVSDRFFRSDPVYEGGEWFGSFAKPEGIYLWITTACFGCENALQKFVYNLMAVKDGNVYTLFNTQGDGVSWGYGRYKFEVEVLEKGLKVSFFHLEDGSWGLLKEKSFENIDISTIPINYKRVWCDRMQDYPISGGYKGKVYEIDIEKVQEKENSPPVIEEIKADPSEAYAPYSGWITCTAYDPDGDDLTYKWYLNGRYLSSSPGGGLHLDLSEAGEYEVGCIVTDGELSSDMAKVAIKVKKEEPSGPSVSIFDITVPDPAVAGSSAAFRVRVRNEGKSRAEVVVGATIITPEGKEQDMPYKVVSIEEGSEREVVFEYTLQENAAPGSYTFITAIWSDESFTPEALIERESRVFKVGERSFICEDFSIGGLPDSITVGEKLGFVLDLSCKGEGSLSISITVDSEKGTIKDRSMTVGFSKKLPIVLDIGESPSIVGPAELKVSVSYGEGRIERSRSFKIEGKAKPKVEVLDISLPHSVSSGHVATFKVRIKNQKKYQGGIVVGATIVASDGTPTDLSPVTLYLGEEGIKEVTFQHFIPPESPKGEYRFITALWEEDGSFNPKGLIERKSKSFYVINRYIELWTDKTRYRMGERIRLGFKLRLDEPGRIYIGAYNGSSIKTMLYEGGSFRIKDGLYPVLGKNPIVLDRWLSLTLEMDTNDLSLGKNIIFVLHISAEDRDDIEVKSVEVEISHKAKGYDMLPVKEGYEIVDSLGFELGGRKYKAFYYEDVNNPGVYYPVVFKERGAFGDLYPVEDEGERRFVTHYAALLKNWSGSFYEMYLDKDYWSDRALRFMDIAEKSNPEKGDRAILAFSLGRAFVTSGVLGPLFSATGLGASLDFYAINFTVEGIQYLSDVFSSWTLEKPMWINWMIAGLMVDPELVLEAFSEDEIEGFILEGVESISKAAEGIQAADMLRTMAEAYRIRRPMIRVYKGILEEAPEGGRLVKVKGYTVEVKNVGSFAKAFGVGILAPVMADFSFKKLGLKDIPVEFKKVLVHYNAHYNLLTRMALRISDKLEELKKDPGATESDLMDIEMLINMVDGLELEAFSFAKQKFEGIRSYGLVGKASISDEVMEDLKGSIKTLEERHKDLMSSWEMIDEAMEGSSRLYSLME